MVHISGGLLGEILGQQEERAVLSHTVSRVTRTYGGLPPGQLLKGNKDETETQFSTIHYIEQHMFIYRCY